MLTDIRWGEVGVVSTVGKIVGQFAPLVPWGQVLIVKSQKWDQGWHQFYPEERGWLAACPGQSLPVAST